MKNILLLISLLLISCGKSITTRNEAVDLSAMKARLSTYEGYYPTCKYPQLVGVSKDTCSSEGTGSGDADVMLWSGLLCLAHEQIGCDTAQQSFQLRTGKAYRSPGRIDNPMSNVIMATDYSRDMFLGSLAYFIGSTDKELASKHISWLKSNGNRLCMSPCDLTMVTWGTAAIVYRWLGLPRTIEMQAGQYLDELGSLPGSMMNEGYQLHLVMVTILLHQKTNTYTEPWRQMAKVIYNKQPKNPFAAYLYLGKRQSMVDLAVSQMPIAKMTDRSEWTFEREQKDSAWTRSMYWEWRFLYNLLEE